MTRTPIAPSLRRSLALSTALGVSLGAFTTPAAAQLGQKGDFGTVTGVTNSSGNNGNPTIALGNTNNPNDTLNVDLNARNTIIDWQSFNVNANHTANFTGGGGTVAVLNRVATGQTNLAGTVNASNNIQLWVINGNGIVVGPGASINAGGLVLSTLALQDQTAFLNSNGTYAVRFAGTGGTISSTATTALPATITTNGGVLAMVSPQIITGAGLATNSGANQTAFVLATDVNLSTRPGGPLSITINAGTAVNSSIDGTVVGDRVYAMLRPQNGVDALLAMPASVSNATVGADGAVVLSGGGLTASVGTNNNIDTLNTGTANTGATTAGLSVGSINLLTPRGVANLTPGAGTILLRAAGGDVTAGALAAASGITVGGATAGTTSGTRAAVVAGAVTTGGNYAVTGALIGLGTSNTAVTQSAGGTVTLTAPGTTTLGNLTVNGADGITTNGAIGAGDAGSLTLTATGTGAVAIRDTNRAGALLISAGTGGATFTTLAGDGAKSIASRGVITGGSIDGAGAVALSSTSGSSAITVVGGIGALAPVASLAVNGGGAVTIGTANTTPVAIDATGLIAVGGTTAPASLRVNGQSRGASFASTVTGNTALGGIAVGDAVTVTGTGNNSTITVDGALDGAGALQVSARNGTRFNGAVGATTALSALTATGATVLAGGGVTTVGNQAYDGGLTLAANTALATGAAGTATFGTGFTGGGRDLSLDLGGVTTVGTALGGLRNLVVNSSTGGTTVIAGNVSTSGSQTYGNPTSLTSNVTLTSTGNNGARQISFGGTLDGLYALTITTQGSLRFGGDVGVRDALTEVDANGVATQIAGNVTTSGRQRYGATTLPGTGTGVITAGGPVTFGSVQGPRGLDVRTTGAVALGDVGNQAALETLTVGGGASLNVGQLVATGAVALGQTTTLGSVAVTGAATVGSLLSASAGTSGFGQISATTGGIGITSAGNVSFASAVAATSAGATITVDAGTGGISGTSFAAGGDVTLTGAGAAAITASVAAGGGYGVTGSTVTLGDANGAAVLQSANGPVSIVATGGAGTAGQVLGRAGLTLAGAGVTIGGANTGDISFAPVSQINAGDGDLRFNTLNGTDLFQVGALIAGTLSQSVAGGTAGTLDRAGALTLGAVTLSGAGNSIRSGGLLTVGNVTLVQGTGAAGARALVLTGDGGVTTGQLVDGAGAIGAVTVAADGAATSAARIAGANLAGALDVRAGTGGVGIGSLAGAGAKTIVSGAGIDGTGATISGGAVRLLAAAGSPVTIGAIGTAAAPVASLVIDGGSVVTLGAGAVAGDTAIGQAAAMGALVINGAFTSGGRFTSTTTGRTALGSLSSVGMLSATAGTAASGDALSFVDLGGAGDKVLRANGSIGGASIGGAGDVTITPAAAGDVTLSGGIGGPGDSIGRLSITRGGAVRIGGGITSTGAVSLGQAGTALGTLTVSGATEAGTDFAALATDAVSLGAVTAGGALTVGSSAGSVSTGALVGSDVNATAGDAATVGGGASAGAFTIAAGGQATVNGDVQAGAGYAVTGRDVTLSGATQQAGAGVTLIADGGTLTGATGLMLVSGTGDVVLGGATTDAIRLSGTTVGAGGLTAATAVRGVTVRTATTGTALVLGDVLADTMGQQIAGDPATPNALVRAGDITTGNLVLGTAGGGTTLASTAGALSVGALTAGGAVVLGADGGTSTTVNGNLTNLAAATAPVQVRGRTVRIGDSALAGALTIAAGGGGATFGQLSGAGAKRLTSAGGLSGTTIDGGAVSLRAGNAPLTVTGAIGGTTAVASLTVDGGSQATFGTAGATPVAINATGAVIIGAAARPGALQINGAVRTSLFNVLSGSDVFFGDLTSDSAISLSGTGNVGFGTLSGAGDKTVTAAGTLFGGNVLGGGAVTLTSGAGVTVTGVIGAPGDAVASLTVNAGDPVVIGGDPATRAITVAGDIAIGQANAPASVQINGGAVAGGAVAVGATGLIDVDELNAGTTLALASTAGGIAFDRLVAPGATSLSAGTGITGDAINGGGALRLLAGGADALTIGSIGAESAAASLTVNGGGVATLGAGGGTPVRVTGATRIGQAADGAATGALVIDGALATGSLLSATTGDTRLGAVTAAGDADVMAGGTATLGAAVTTGGAYRVRGGTVALAGGVTQAAAGLVDIVATAGGVTGGDGLILQSNSDGAGAEYLAIDAAGPLALGGTTLLGGTAADQSDIGLFGTTGTLALGTVTGRALGGFDATRGTLAGLVAAGDVTASGPITVARTLALSSTGGAITLGDFAVTDAGAGIALATTGTVGGPAGGAIAARSLSATGSIGIDARGAADVTTATGGSGSIRGATASLGTGDFGGALSLASTAGDVLVGTRLTAAGPIAITATSNAVLAPVTASAGTLLVEAGGAVGGLAGGRATLSATGAGGNVDVRAGTGALLGAVDAGGTLAIAATTLDATALVAGGDVTTRSSGTSTIGTVQSKGGAIAVTGQSVGATRADAAGALALRATGGALTLAGGRAGGAATLSATTTLTTTGALDVTGAATLTSGGVATLAPVTTGAALAVTTGGNLTLAGAQAGGAAGFDVTGMATLGQITAATITTRADDVQLSGAQRAATVSFINRSPGTATVKLGDALTGTGFALSADEANLVDAGQLVVDGGAGTVEVGALALNAAAGRNRVDVLSTGRIDVLDTLSGTGTGRTVRLGGTLSASGGKAAAIRVVATGAGGGRLLFDTADLELRGNRIGVGLATNFLDAIGFGTTPGLSPADVNKTYVGNADSALYNSTFSGAAYTQPVLVSARSLTVRYSDYALFQNTGVAGQNGGVALGVAGAPLANSLVVQGPGTGLGGFALFGTIGGIGGTAAAVLGQSVLAVNAADLANTRINGCVAGSGAGCLTSVVVQPTLNVFDNSRAAVFRAADDLTVPFDPLLGTNNEALFTGAGLLDPTANATGCADTTSPNCGQQGELGN